MSVKFVLGPAGSGKTEYMLRELIAESIEHPKQNYLYIVPEQFSMEAQRDVVTMHPRHGSMNIDAIGLNRLAYRVFDELSIETGQVLEDFGKSMLIRKIMSEEKDNLLVYGRYSDRMGFVDEMKSMMSELFQYAVSREAVDDAISRLSPDTPVARKLHDIQLVYDRFESYNAQNGRIVAEQLTSLLADVADRSRLIADSHMYFDGFTGFTPVQMRLVEKLMKCARSVTFAFVIDVREISLAQPKEYELFRLTKETLIKLRKAAADVQADTEDDVLMNGETGREDADGSEHAANIHGDALTHRDSVPYRFRGNDELAALAANLFRYPHGRYDKTPENVRLVSVNRAADEAAYVASQIRRLVKSGRYRYKDIAVVAGDLTDVAQYYRHAMDEYDIPVFIDANVSMKGDPCSDTIRSFLAVMSDNFSFESMFRLLKSGMTGVDTDDVERLENYVLATNLRGLRRWQRGFEDKRNPEYAADMDSVRAQVMGLFTDECLEVFRPSAQKAQNTVRAYTEELYSFLVRLDVCGQLEKRKEYLYEKERWDEGDAYGRIFDKAVSLFDKLVSILGDELMTVGEYADVLDAGLSDMEIGIVPPTIDRVVVGDMTRSRLNHVKVLFFTGVNEGIIPKPPKKGRLLSDSDRSRLEDCGMSLAPSERTNAYTEQFYIYTNITKPSDALYVVYRRLGEDMRAAKPSYLVDRLRGIFPALREETYDRDDELPETCDGVLRYMVSHTADGDDGQTKAVRDILEDYGCMRQLEAVSAGQSYVNLPCELSQESIRMLYGEKLAVSVSKLEEYAECRFKYFLTYGLGLTERETCEVSAANVGTILHRTMEKMFSYVKKNRGNDWTGLSDEELAERTDAFARETADEEGGYYFEDSERTGYMRDLLSDVAVRAVRTLRAFVRCGKMEPQNFERRFDTSGEKDNIADYIFELANGLTMSLVGTVDRIDEYKDGDKLYFKVIDYKSSDTKLDMRKVLGGLQLQLLTYGAVAKELEKRRHGTDVHIGGVFYYSFDNQLVDISGVNKAKYSESGDGFETDGTETFGGVDVDSIEFQLLKQSRYSGLFCSDSASLAATDEKKETLRRDDGISEKELDELIEVNRKNIERLAQNISEGKIDINPVREGNTVDACKYCEYRRICMFDARYGGNAYSPIASPEDSTQ